MARPQFHEQVTEGPLRGCWAPIVLGVPSTTAANVLKLREQEARAIIASGGKLANASRPSQLFCAEWPWLEDVVDVNFEVICVVGDGTAVGSDSECSTAKAEPATA